MQDGYQSSFTSKHLGLEECLQVSHHEKSTKYHEGGACRYAKHHCLTSKHLGLEECLQVNPHEKSTNYHKWAASHHAKCQFITLKVHANTYYHIKYKSMTNQKDLRNTVVKINLRNMY